LVNVTAVAVSMAAFMLIAAPPAQRRRVQWWYGAAWQARNACLRTLCATWVLSFTNPSAPWPRMRWRIFV